MKKRFVYLILPIIMLTACNNKKNNASWMDNEHIDMSDKLLLSDESVLTDMPEYTKIRGGESQTIDRSFENAPPLIPHRIGGFIPVKIDDNKCLRCHMPDKAPEFNATALPRTHFTSYRPEIIMEDGIYRVDAIEGEVVERDLGHFNGAMFNCTQCHVPQAEVSVEIPNTFDPDYRKNTNRTQSNLKDNMGEGVR